MEKISILTTLVPFDKSDYLSLLSLSVGAAISRQKKMGELVIGASGWNVDVRNRRIKFGENEFDCGIIGSESYQSNTWLWGWANTESGVPEICFAPSRRAKRNFPECAEFSTGKFMLDEIHTGHNLSMITVSVSEKNACYYRCPYDGGALFVQIEGLPESVFAPIFFLSTRYSTTAHAMLRPSNVLVPRPISSRITRLSLVAYFRICATSFISTMNVL